MMNKSDLERIRIEQIGMYRTSDGLWKILRIKKSENRSYELIKETYILCIYVIS